MRQGAILSDLPLFGCRDEVNHLKVEVLGTVSARATDHENEMREIKKAMDGLACKADMKSITDKVPSRSAQRLKPSAPTLESRGFGNHDFACQAGGHLREVGLPKLRAQGTSSLFPTLLPLPPSLSLSLSLSRSLPPSLPPSLPTLPPSRPPGPARSPPSFSSQAGQQESSRPLLTAKADLLLEWQQPLLQALGTNQAELTAQLAGLSASQSHLWEKMASQLGRHSAHSGELETRISRNHEDLTSRLEQHADSFTQLKQQRDQLLHEQQRQLDQVLSALTDRNQKLLSQLTVQLETVSTEQKELSADSLKQLMQQLDLLLQQFDPLTEVTQHCDQLLREQRQQLNPAMRSVQDQSQELLAQLTTGLEGLSASSQQLSVDSLKELKQRCDQLQQEQQQHLVPLTQFTQSCGQLLQEQGQLLHPLMQLTQNCDQVLQQQQHQLDNLRSIVQDHRQELLTQVGSHLDKLDNLSAESKELSANSVAELKQHHRQLLQEQQQRLDPLLNSLQDQLLSQLAVQLESLSAEQKELSTDSLVQLKQQYDQLREQQQQLNPLLSTLQDHNQELLLQLETQLDDQLDSLSAEQKRLSADSIRQLTKQWEQLQKDQRKQFDQLLKPGERSHELLTQLKTSLEALSQEQKQLRTEVLNQPTMPSVPIPVQQTDPGLHLQLDPVSTLQDQLAGLSGRAQLMPQTPERIPTPPQTPSPRRLAMTQSPQQQSPTKMLQDYQDMVLLKRHEVAHAKSDQSDLVIVRRISSYYLHVMKSA